MNTERLTVKFHSRTVGRLSLTPDNRLCAFEYDAGWLFDGFSISPLELPLREGLFIAKPRPFYGNFGVFEDSLPDGYGRYLLHKALMKQGIDDGSLSSLDRLSIVGSGGMGALEYYPETRIRMDESLMDFDELQRKALKVLGEPTHEASAETQARLGYALQEGGRQSQQDDDASLLLYNSGNSGGCRPKAIFEDNEGHWIVKFRHTYDPHDMGIQEYRYNEAARRCGIDVPDFKLVNGKYFATRRFDISPGGERIHVATAGGLLGVSISEPVLDYANLLALTGYITQNKDDVEEMFRRMVFNYLADNKDDHCKNFSFRVIRDGKGKWTWRLAPAYDLTHCTEGYNGEHATSVNSTSRPTFEDFLAVGMKTKISPARCRELYEQVRDFALNLE